MRPFVPYFRNPHLLTIAGNYWRRDLDEQRFPVEAKFYDTEPGVRVLVHSQAPAGEPAAPAGTGEQTAPLPWVVSWGRQKIR